MFFLLYAECIESNPGPVDKGASGRGQPSGRGSNRSGSAGQTQDRRQTPNSIGNCNRLRNNTLADDTYANIVNSPPNTRSSQLQADLNRWLKDTHEAPVTDSQLPSNTVNQPKHPDESALSDTSTILDFGMSSNPTGLNISIDPSQIQMPCC